MNELIPNNGNYDTIVKLRYIGVILSILGVGVSLYSLYLYNQK